MHSSLQIHAEWPVFKHRTLMNEKKLKDFLEEFETRPSPKSKFQTLQCGQCKKMGHHIRQCPDRLFSIQELGLTELYEKSLYEFLRSLDYTIHKNQDFCQYNSRELFEQSLRRWMQIEYDFWKRLNLFFEERNQTELASLFNETEFSKGRLALGFNYAMGATLPELILDAFGAVLDLVKPPDACIFYSERSY